MCFNWRKLLHYSTNSTPIALTHDRASAFMFSLLKICHMFFVN